LTLLQASSDRERVSAHGEVIALQETLGISYKDAAHRLYMAELEKVKAHEKMAKSFANLQKSVDTTLEMAYKAINEIERNSIDNESTQ
jgi:hypothetical protein